ncbi:unnamed protein product [Paramecium primaurelia]|uniref:Methyltransferase domain-containing protein n=1 Tax=Paramecium primaurelia TaxID=5886 RepID=A0A8S1Q2I0_PARPR|nr:unnamed protein product [Paramecium primaurelia]
MDNCVQQNCEENQLCDKQHCNQQKDAQQQLGSNTNCCESEEQIKNNVKQRYGEICEQKLSINSGCCSTSGCGTIDYALFAEKYQNLQGYIPEADLGLGCGIPTEFAELKKGDVVLDLGSGAGNDCFIAKAQVGESGRVIGVDMTPSMIRKAQLNSDKYNIRNVEFRQGDITDIPVLDNYVDVVISNCVINLVPDKRKVFSEIHRVLKQNGHFSISDVLSTGDLPLAIRQAQELHIGGVSGALRKDVYLKTLEELGFTDIKIKKEKVIDFPEELMLQYVSKEVLNEFENSGTKILSATIFARKK